MRLSLTWALALVLTVIVSQLSRSDSAQWSKIKKCQDLGFCRRHRSQRFDPAQKYSVNPSSVRIDDGALIGLLARGKESAQLEFRVYKYPKGVWRVTVDDHPQTKWRRYRVKDVVLDSFARVPLGSSENEGEGMRVEDGKAVVDAADGRLVVVFDPFVIQLWSQNGVQKILELNSRGRFVFEKHREKPSPKPSPKAEESDAMDKGGGEAGDSEKTEEIENPEELCDGCWEESFQSHSDPKIRGPESVGVDISFPQATHLYGIPSRTVSLSLPATMKVDGTPITEPYRMYNLDVFEYELNKPLGLYGAIPLMIGVGEQRTAAVLWLNAAETYADIPETGEKERGRSAHFFSEAGIMDVYLLSGGLGAEAYYSQYHYLTGPAAMPQKFSLGYHQSRWNYRDTADVLEVDAGFEKHSIPYDVIWLDIEHTDGKRYFTWDSSKFADPVGLQKNISAHGRHMVTIIDPHIKRDDNYAVHRLGKEKSMYIKKSDGKDYDAWCWPGSSSYVDFTSERVTSTWASLFNPKDYPGFTSILHTWVDMNEPSVFNGPEATMPKDLIHEDGWEHRDVHNVYGFYVQRAAYAGLKAGHAKNDERPFVLSRSFFAGSHRYGTVWTGDNSASKEHLAATPSMLLALQISGLTFSGADIGGFFGNPSQLVLARWYQAAGFQPFFRGHAHLDTNRREPWLFGDKMTSLIRSAIRERYAFLPFWYTLFARQHVEYDFTWGDRHGGTKDVVGPPMRPMWWHFRNMNDVEDQWMVGASLLAAPVLDEAETIERKVLLPENEVWYDIYGDKKQILGRGSHHVVKANLERMIAFQRGGTIIPRQERRRRSTVAMVKDPYTLWVALDKDGSAQGELYLDDGKTFAFEKGNRVMAGFFFEGKTLASEILAGEDSERFEGRDAVVERIIVMGMEPVNRVTVDGRSVTFVYDKDRKIVTVKRPDIPVAKGGWKVLFE